MKKAIEVKNLYIYYDTDCVVKNISIDIPENLITAVIGPSGCGKSSFLRSINRMNDLVPKASIKGTIQFHGVDIHDPEMNEIELRRRIGMVFQKPNPFPFTIFDNVAYGLKIQGVKDESIIADRVEESLKRAALWNEVKDRLNLSALQLSGGQQQRLCIARALAVYPEVLLLDEPCASLDPGATSKIEELLLKLKKEITIVIVTHNLYQAKRISDYLGFFHSGKLLEYGRTKTVFAKPREQLTRDYLRGDFG